MSVEMVELPENQRARLEEYELQSILRLVGPG